MIRNLLKVASVFLFAFAAVAEIRPGDLVFDITPDPKGTVCATAEGISWTCAVTNGQMTLRVSGGGTKRYAFARFHLPQKPERRGGRWDWRNKVFEVELGDVGERELVYTAKLTDPDVMAKYGKTLAERTWMFGHDSGVYDGPKNRFNLPVSEAVPMADACAEMGVTNCCVVRWESTSHAYNEQFKRLGHISWVLSSGYRNTYASLREHALDLAIKIDNLVGYDLDDMFLEEPPVREFDSAGREIRVAPSRPTYRELIELKDYMGGYNCVKRPLELRAVIYSHQIRPEVKPVLDLMDVILFWTWSGRDVDRLDENFAALRALEPEKPVLLGLYMWDFGGKKPLADETVAKQLDFALRKFRTGEIDGVIFHCTPLVNKNLKAVETCRAWLKAYGGIVCGKRP